MAHSLITGHIERIKSDIFDDYHSEITKLIGRQQGVYALYKKDRLYYVGLAINLRSRVKHHLKDKHANKWDSFSLYLIHQVEHLRELEALILHIAEPKGNLQRGKISKSVNLKKALRVMLIAKNKSQVESMLGGSSRKRSPKKRSSRKAPKEPMLHKLLSPGTQLRAKYKGKEYFATIEPDGKLSLNGKKYNTPSGAGKSIVDRRTVNGWTFWQYQDKKGKWVKLKTLL